MWHRFGRPLLEVKVQTRIFLRFGRFLIPVAEIITEVSKENNRFSMKQKTTGQREQQYNFQNENKILKNDERLDDGRLIV